MLAILHAIKKCHQYQLGRHFKVSINHSSFKYFLEQQVSSEGQQKWTTKMKSYDFEVIYKKGKDNIAVNALSR